jgi:hypothetical protein
VDPDVDIEVRGAAGFLAPPPAQAFTLTNGTDCRVSWQAIGVYEEESPEWLSVTPSSGQLAPRGDADGFDSVTVSVRPVAGIINELPAGTHVATVKFQETQQAVTGTLTTFPITSRAAVVIADPVLRVSSSVIGASLSLAPGGSQVAGASPAGFSYTFGQLVTITAVAPNGYQFVGWAGEVPEGQADDNPLIVTMDRSRELIANIQPIPRTLTLSMTGNGTGTVRLSPTGTFTENALISQFPNGRTVTLTAEADAGAVFVGWAGNVPAGREDDNPLSVTMDRDRVITARFELAVRLNVSILGSGEVLIDPERELYAAGTVVTLTAVAGDTFEFAGWGGDVTGGSSVLVLVLEGDKTVTASFEPEGANDNDNTSPDTAALVVTIVGDGVVTPNGGVFDNGAEVTLIATPGVGSVFVRWDWDGSGTELMTTVLMDGEQNVRAVFAEDPSAPRDNPGTASPCGAVGIWGVPLSVLGWATLAGVHGRRWRCRAK